MGYYQDRTLRLWKYNKSMWIFQLRQFTETNKRKSVDINISLSLEIFFSKNIFTKAKILQVLFIC